MLFVLIARHLVDAFRHRVLTSVQDRRRSPMERRIYLDHAATTPPDTRVPEAMLPYLRDVFGTPSSIYYEAREARKGLDNARRTVAELLGAKPSEVIFTSGGSESDNAAGRGVAPAWRLRGNHIIASAIEHHAVVHGAQELEHQGFRVSYLPVDRYGFADVAALAAALDDQAILAPLLYP